MLLRFELEREMFAGELDLRRPARGVERAHARVPRRRRARRLRTACCRTCTGRRALFGYFPTYSLGNIIAGQLWEAAHEALPDLEERIEHGELAPLREWLREHVHRHGRKLESAEIVERATGRPIEIGPYVRYLSEKYGEIYGLDPPAPTQPLAQALSRGGGGPGVDPLIRPRHTGYRPRDH